jgi:hypothetical protein
MRLRLVTARVVNYTETSANSTALGALTGGSGVFSNVRALRDQYGADLVTLLRPFKYAAQQTCGTSWLNGASGSMLSSYFGFSVAGDGRDGSAYCTDYAMVHEMGHNMGSSHDRANAGSPGKFPYSYGYGVSSQFGSIMSYQNPRIGIFSNPRINLCNGYPCGIDSTSPAAADNAQSLNNVAATVAAFRATKIAF